MKNESKFSKCPRCQDQTLEHLTTYAFCGGCLYSSEESDFEADRSPRIIQETIVASRGIKRKGARTSRRAALVIAALGAMTLFSACTTCPPSPRECRYSRWYDMRNVEGRRQ